MFGTDFNHYVFFIKLIEKMFNTLLKYLSLSVHKPGYVLNLNFSIQK